MSGNARRSPAQTCLSACAPVAPVGTGAWNSTSGSTTSSIAFAMTSASPLFTASCKRLSTALLAATWAADMLLLLGLYACSSQQYDETAGQNVTREPRAAATTIWSEQSDRAGGPLRTRPSPA